MLLMVGISCYVHAVILLLQPSIMPVVASISCRLHMGIVFWFLCIQLWTLHSFQDESIKTANISNEKRLLEEAKEIRKSERREHSTSVDLYDAAVQALKWQRKSVRNEKIKTAKLVLRINRKRLLAEAKEIRKSDRLERKKHAKLIVRQERAKHLLQENYGPPTRYYHGAQLRQRVLRVRVYSTPIFSSEPGFYPPWSQFDRYQRFEGTISNLGVGSKWDRGKLKKRLLRDVKMKKRNLKKRRLEKKKPLIQRGVSWGSKPDVQCFLGPLSVHVLRGRKWQLANKTRFQRTVEKPVYKWAKKVKYQEEAMKLKEELRQKEMLWHDVGEVDVAEKLLMKKKEQQVEEMKLKEELRQKEMLCLDVLEVGMQLQVEIGMQLQVEIRFFGLVRVMTKVERRSQRRKDERVASRLDSLQRVTAAPTTAYGTRLEKKRQREKRASREKREKQVRHEVNLRFGKGFSSDTEGDGPSDHKPVPGPAPTLPLFVCAPPVDLLCVADVVEPPSVCPSVPIQNVIAEPSIEQNGNDLVNDLGVYWGDLRPIIESEFGELGQEVGNIQVVHRRLLGDRVLAVHDVTKLIRGKWKCGMEIHENELEKLLMLEVDLVYIYELVTGLVFPVDMGHIEPIAVEDARPAARLTGAALRSFKAREKRLLMSLKAREKRLNRSVEVTFYSVYFLCVLCVFLY